MTVFDIFKWVDLLLRGPVPWGAAVAEPDAGVYVVARVDNPLGGCLPCTVPFIDPVPPHRVLDLEYEQWRWLPSEPIIYIGKTDRPICERLAEFRRHRCGDLSPHAGGQVIKLLHCDLWVYWSRSPTPYDTEQRMLCIFKEQAGQVPFANNDGKRRERRVRRAS